LKLAEKSARDGKKVVKRQPPEHNFVNWDKNTYTRLMSAPPERLISRFQVTHAMLLNVLSRPGDGCLAMQRLLRDCHESPKQKNAHRRRAWQLFRSLVEHKIIEFINPGRSRREEAPSTNAEAHRPSTESSQILLTSAPAGAKLRVNVTLQEDFSMDQTLSLYLLETLPLMDPQAPDYALVVLTLAESIVEDPDVILRRQLSRVKDQKMAEMKADGVAYEQRMDELEKLEYPKPNREFIYSTFNAFAARHPWVGQENIRPKSIAREMFEAFRSFSDYIRNYELQRAEGVLLRHLNGVLKVLTQTVPDTAKNDTLREMEIYLSTMLRQVDASLMDEWERMRNPSFQRAETPEVRPPGAEEAARDITRDTKAFTAAIRTRVFSFLRAWVNGDAEAALANFASPEDAEGVAWTAERLRLAMDGFLVGHRHLCLDPEARNARHTYVIPAEDKLAWRVQQMLVDPEAHNDWVAEFSVDLAASRAAEEPVVRLRRIGSLV
ncbi:MAG: DUF3516 domain-containing protein, partial [Proteobacteria bacterium]|nr:DUF3516 domain-containing protein [Pseudomonadota bacterium]